MSLAPDQIARAVRQNPGSAHRGGWLNQYDRIARVFGLEQGTPTAADFAQAVATWQATHRPLAVDGILGTNTWRKLEPETRSATGGGIAVPAWLQASPAVETATVEPFGSGPLWLQIAHAELQRWDTEVASWTSARQQSNPEKHLDWDEQYFAASPRWGNVIHAPGQMSDKPNRDWCAAFVNWCLHKAGYSHTGSAGAGSFLVPSRWRFRALKEARQGCVVVPGKDKAEHVTFLWDFEGPATAPRKVRTLGGNQNGQRVTIKSYERRPLRSARGSDGVSSPFLWPEIGEPVCTIPLPTEQGHYCGTIPT